MSSGWSLPFFTPDDICLVQGSFSTRGITGLKLQAPKGREGQRKGGYERTSNRMQGTFLTPSLPSFLLFVLYFFLHFFHPLCLNRSPSDHLELTQWFLVSQEATKLVSSRASKSVTAYDPIRKSHPQFSHTHTYIIWKVHSKGLPGIKQTDVALSLLSAVHLYHFLACGR